MLPFERVHQTASQNPANAYHIGRNIQGSLFSLCQPLFCSELCPSNHELAVQRLFRFWGSLLFRSGLDQSGMCPGLAPISRLHGEHGLCPSYEDIQSLPQARVRRGKQLSQELTRITPKLPNSASNHCRGRPEPIRCPWAFRGITNLSFHPSTSRSPAPLGDEKAHSYLRFFIWLYPGFRKLSPATFIRVCSHGPLLEGGSTEYRAESLVTATKFMSWFGFCFRIVSSYYLGSVWTKHLCPSHQNPYVETPTPKGTVFEEKAFMEVIKIKWGYKKGGALIQQDLHPKKRHQRVPPDPSALMCLCKPVRTLLSETDPARPCTLQKCENINSHCLGQQVYGILLWPLEQTNRGLSLKLNSW